MSTNVPNLSVEIAGVRLSNPLILASGIWGTSSQLLVRAAHLGAGGVTAKSCGPEPRPGHPNPTLLDWQHGLINAVGLPNPGAEAEISVLQEAKLQLQSLGVPLIASIFADRIETFSRVAEIVSRAEPNLIEVNISCPNVADEFGLPFAASVKSATAVTRIVKNATDIPISIKLAPNVPHIGSVAQAVVEAGADSITAINTMPGMVIDVASGQPILANRIGGISGPALKPIALRSVYEIARRVDVPIIGTGGVLTGTDVVEMLMAGATAVGIGSAIYYRELDSFTLIRQELINFMSTNNYNCLDELRGLAHLKPSHLFSPSIPPIP